MKKKILIIGSNFGSIIHLAAIKKLNNYKKIFICSPNINNKNLMNNKIVKFEDYKKALKHNYKVVGIVTPPNIQKEICEYILKNNKKVKCILLEKPVAVKFKDTKKIINGLNKNNTKFLVNFIFENISAFKKLIKILKKKKIQEVKYKWTFKQMYFQNKLKTWKIDNNLGGGLVNYYLIHVFYNLNLFLNELKIIKIETEKTRKLITKLDLKIQDKNKTNIFIHMNINSNIKEHFISFKTKKNEYSIINKSNDWVKNFYLYKDKKKINLQNIKLGRDNLTMQNYIKLLSHKKIKKVTTKKILKSHKLCDEIITKIYK